MDTKRSDLDLSSVLTIIFVVLKLVGVINWSWIWVLCPIWIDLLLTIVVLIIFAIVDWHFTKKYDKSRRIKW